MMASAAALTLPAVCQAHGGEHEASWSLDPWTVSLIGVSVLAYVAGTARLLRAGRIGVLGMRRIAAFLGGCGMLIIALVSPLDHLAESAFSAHMCQHILLMLAAPPLLVVSHPLVAWLWCFPRGLRRSISRWWAGGSAARRVIGGSLNPIVVWIGASIALWFWHAPGPYQWALGNETVHAVEHATFLFSALAFWYLLFEPRGRGRLGYGGAMLYGLSFGIQNGLLGAILTFASHPLYLAYQGPHAAGLFGLTALEDQQLAGLFMWVPTGIVHLGLLIILFLGWMAHSERTATAGQHQARRREERQGIATIHP
jgi:putative membrane protein